MSTDTLFNGSVETSIRMLIILEALYPSTADLQTLSLLDYFLVHTEDIGGPNNLHKEIATRWLDPENRQNELRAALSELLRLDLAAVTTPGDDPLYTAGDNAPAFLKLLFTDYNLELISRANWLAGQLRENDALLATMEAMMAEWRQERVIDTDYPRL